MRRVIVICEGDTEKEFCSKLLNAHLASMNIYIQAPVIKKSMGGIVKWEALKRQINLHLATEKETIVTTFIDYYGLRTKLEFPKWDESLNIIDKYSRLDFLEKAMLEDIDNNLRHRFIPYIQLHEFEGLLFSDIQVFSQQIPKDELIGANDLSQIENIETPELINDNVQTAPSKRLEKIITGYNKVVYGYYLAEAIGLVKIRSKCKRFDNWLHKIESL